MLDKIVILGAGESGCGTALLAKKQGWEVFVSDQGTISKSARNTLDGLGIEWEEETHTLSKNAGCPIHNEKSRDSCQESNITIS